MFSFRSLCQATLSLVRLFLSIAEVIYELCLFLPLRLLDYLAIQVPEPVQDEPWLPDTGQLSLFKTAIDDVEDEEATAPKASEAEALPDLASGENRNEERKEEEPLTDRPASSPKAKEEMPGHGMSVSVKKLYRTESKYYTTWSEEYPKEIEKEIEERTERKRHAFIVKMERSDGDDEMEGMEGDDDYGMQIYSITVQSPLVKRIIADILKNYPGFSKSTEEFERPFIPFYHRLENLNRAMKQHDREDLEDDVAINTRSHLKVFYRILMKGLQKTIDRSQALVDRAHISYKYFWTIFPPGKLVVHRDRIYRLKRLSGSCLRCQYIDWDGDKFGYADEDIYIKPFDGTKLITDLNIFPLQSHEDRPNFTARLEKRGRTFVALSGHHYKTYKGEIQEKAKWDGFIGFGYSNSRDVRRTVDGRIVIDTKLYEEYNRYSVKSLSPLWKSQPRAEDDDAEDSDWSTDSFPGRKLESNHTQKGSLCGEELLICTTVLRGFSLKTKSWAEFHIGGVTDIVWDDAAFESLVLEQRYKDLILSVVDSQIVNGHEFDDFIMGKGQGMNMLFSGPPGVGKTLTAESIAEYMRKPLYSIAAGELGLKSSSVEENLKKIFELSIKLDAVVLLDEADVFLQKRSTDNLERNALVTVFLRVLEYYMGVLFLTTNQVDSFDPAFLSRIHININFPKLEPPARKRIWSSFLNMSPLENNVGSAELDRIATQYVMNGRQIKNAIKTAQLLARRNAHHPVLTAEIIDTVVAVTIPESLTSNRSYAPCSTE